MNFFCFFLGFLSKLLMFLLKVTKVTTGHKKLAKMGQNSIKSSFFAQRAKKASAECRSPSQELEVGPRSGPYLLVDLKEYNIARRREFMADRRCAEDDYTPEK